ncbi:MAG: CPBP family glutamic-type intramembrane protease, partial [Candidatus Hodarchaeales archaeon]
PENVLTKWILIISIEYIISFWIISFTITFYTFNNSIALVGFLILTAIVGLAIVIITYGKMFPKIKEDEEIYEDQKRVLRIIKPTLFSKHPIRSILVVLILYYLSTLFSRFLESILIPSWDSPWIEQYWINLAVYNILMLVLYNLSSLALFVVLIPQVFGIPYGKQPITQYLESIKSGWLKPLVKYFLWGLIVVIGVLIFLFTTGFLLTGIVSFPVWMNIQNFAFILYSSEIIWQEVVFQGILLTILLENKGKKTSIFLNSLIYLVFSLLELNIAINFPLTLYLPVLIFLLIISTFLSAFFAFLRIKTGSILPGILGHITLYLISFPISLGWFIFISY